MRVAVAGASGFIGRRLAAELVDAGHEVVALGRRLENLPSGPSVHPVAADAGNAGQMEQALKGAGAAYYLVHSMAGPDEFAERDARLAASFAQAAAAAGTGRIVYLGALGRGELSTHLASRQQVGEILGSTGVPVVELRAAVVLGAGSVSFEMLRYLVERLPFMVCPRWVLTRVEAVAQEDVISYLKGSLDVEPGIYEIGSGEAASYQELMHRFTAVRGLMKRLIVNVPLLTPRLSAYWVDLVTPLDRRVTHALIESLVSEVVVESPQRTRDAFGFDPQGLDAALRRALDDQSSRVSEELLDARAGLRDGVYTVRMEVPLQPGEAQAIRADLKGIGGDLAWYGLPLGWKVRLALGRMAGERGGLKSAAALSRGSQVDWWTVEDAADGRLVLRAPGWVTGEGWLGYRVEDARLIQVAAFRPRGVPGLLYWWLLQPVHALAFQAMAARRLTRARAGAAAPAG